MSAVLDSRVPDDLAIRIKRAEEAYQTGMPVQAPIHRHRCKYCIRETCERLGIPFHWDGTDPATGRAKDYYIVWETCPDPDHQALAADELDKTQSRLPSVTKETLEDIALQKTALLSDLLGDEEVKAGAPGDLDKTTRLQDLLKEPETPPENVQPILPESRLILVSLTHDPLPSVVQKLDQRQQTALREAALFKTVPPGETEPLCMRVLPSWMSS